MVQSRFDEEAEIEFSWSADALVPDGTYELRDLWAHTDLGNVTVGEGGDIWSGALDEHDSWAFTLTPI